MKNLTGQEEIDAAIGVAHKIFRGELIPAEEAEFYMRYEVKNAFVLGAEAAGATRDHAYSMWERGWGQA